ncbi:MAG: hypothetical protein DKT66_23260 [Candidatus Melainabacteria bacterium]|nr:MAG: hypothetical protein DKT66_23260 [Candidatus Melainabacteria bacterium]
MKLPLSARSRDSSKVHISAPALQFHFFAKEIPISGLRKHINLISLLVRTANALESLKLAFSEPFQYQSTCRQSFRASSKLSGTYISGLWKVAFCPEVL